MSERLLPGTRVPVAEVTVRATRSSGPGGQHANTSDTRVEAVLDVERSSVLSQAEKRRVVERAGPRLTAVAQDARSQARNRELALERLGRKLVRALYVRPQRRPTRPGRGVVERRLAAKRRNAERKQGRRRPADLD